MEPTEIDEFRKQVKEGGESGLSYVSLAISILAVLVAMVTVLGHRTHTEAVLQQARASDQWNEYQAKKTRQNEDMIASTQPISSPDPQKILQGYKLEIDKLSKELPEEKKQAEEFEADVKKAEQQAGHYDLGEALLEIAVVLTSITLLTRQKVFFLGGLVLGIAGALIAGYALILH